MKNWRRRSLWKFCPIPEGRGGYDQAAEADARRRSHAEEVAGFLFIKFEQKDGDLNMNLTLKSDFPITLKYDAIMFVPTQRGPQPAPTSSCPLLGRTGGVELWPHAVTLLLLTNLRLQPTDR